MDTSWKRGSLVRRGPTAADRSALPRSVMLSRTRSTVATTLCRRLYFLRSFSASHESEYRDVVIVGGGPAGLALASALGAL